MTEHCRKSDFVGSIAGDSCPECGHVNLLHPGPNKAMTECLVCRLEALLA